MVEGTATNQRLGARLRPRAPCKGRGRFRNPAEDPQWPRNKGTIRVHKGAHPTGPDPIAPSRDGPGTPWALCPVCSRVPSGVRHRHNCLEGASSTFAIFWGGANEYGRSSRGHKREFLGYNTSKKKELLSGQKKTLGMPFMCRPQGGGSLNGAMGRGRPASPGRGDSRCCLVRHAQWP